MNKAVELIQGQLELTRRAIVDQEQLIAKKRERSRAYECDIKAAAAARDRLEAEVLVAQGILDSMFKEKRDLVSALIRLEAGTTVGPSEALAETDEVLQNWNGDIGDLCVTLTDKFVLVRKK